VESSKAVRYIDSNHYKILEGKRAIELLSEKKVLFRRWWRQIPTRIYTMRFLLGQASDGCQEPMAVMDFVGDQADSFHFNNPPTNNIYEPNNVTFTAKAERTRIVYVKLHEKNHKTFT
jgi:hypothetical protein